MSLSMVEIKPLIEVLAVKPDAVEQAMIDQQAEHFFADSSSKFYRFELFVFRLGNEDEGIYRCMLPGCSGGDCEAFKLAPGFVTGDTLQELWRHAMMHEHKLWTCEAGK